MLYLLELFLHNIRNQGIHHGADTCGIEICSLILGLRLELRPQCIKMRQFDRVKNECSKQIRDYVEGIMPFYIAFDLSQDVSEQLLREEHMRQYLASTQQLSVLMLKDAISATNMVAADRIDSLSHCIYESISTTLCPEKDPDKFQFIHDLSNEQRKQVSAVLGQLDNFRPHDMIRAIHSKKDAAEKYEKVSRQFRESLPSVDVNVFLKKFSDLSKEITECDNAIPAAKKQLDKWNADKPLLKKEVTVQFIPFLFRKSARFFELRFKIFFFIFRGSSSMFQLL